MERLKIVISTDPDCGWYSENPAIPQAAFHPEIVAAVEQGRVARALEIADYFWPEGNWTASHLSVVDVPSGAVVKIEQDLLGERVNFVVGAVLLADQVYLNKYDVRQYDEL